MEADLRGILLQCLANGPTVALFDCSHPEMRGFAAAGEPRVLVLRFAFPEEREPLAESEGPTFPWVHGTDAGSATAVLAWAALIGVAGPYAPKQRAVAVERSDRLPAYLGAEPERTGQVHRMLRQFARIRASSDWRFDGRGTPAGVPDLAPQPDKREAILTLAANPQSALALLVRRDVAGVELEPAPPEGEIVEIPLARQGLRPNGLRLVGHLEREGLPFGAVSLPWDAIIAMQDRNDGHGWFWPDDLPAGAAVRADEAFATLTGRRGVPLTEPDPLPLVMLPAAPVTDKRQAILASQRQGGAILLVSTTAEGSQFPGDFGDLAFLAVPLALPTEFGEANPEVTGLFVRTTLPDFNGKARRLTLTWNAIFAVATNEGSARVHAWPQDYPEAVRRVLRAGEHLRRTGQVLDEAGIEPVAAGTPLETPGLGVTDADGHVRAVLRQPVGPDAAGEQRVFEMEFMLPGVGPG